MHDDHNRHAIVLRGGKFTIGTSDTILPDDGEKPTRSVRIKPFAIDPVAITNCRFAMFVESTGYVTDAERFGWSYVFQAMVNGPGQYDRLPGADWWCAVPEARWDQPEGASSGIAERGEHPVVHISRNDALAFAGWAGGRLPTEAEREFAARGGLDQQRYPLGNREPDNVAFQPCNIWQGEFPFINTIAGGYLSTAPAQSFEPNGFGLFNMVGNVWEWTKDVFRVRSLRRSTKRQPKKQNEEQIYVLKGGSYICHKSYCYRYRVAARSSNTANSLTGHTGF